MKFLVGIPLGLFMLVTGAIGVVLDSAPTPGVTVVVQGPLGTVATTAELIAACGVVAHLAASDGVVGSDLVMFTAIAGAESHCAPDALGDMYPIHGLLCPSHGFMQIRSCPGTPNGLDRGSREWLIDPVNNVRKAIAMFRHEGWSPWSTWRNGLYLDWTEVALAATEGLR